MKVKELIEVMTNCDDAEVIVRENGHGKWIQGYRIGKDVHLYRYEYRAENRQKSWSLEHKEAALKKGEEADVDYCGTPGLKMKVIKKSLNKMPEYIANLEVCWVQPRHVPYIHKDPMTKNEYSLEIYCYPDGWVPEPIEKKKKQNDAEDYEQVMIMDLLKEVE